MKRQDWQAIRFLLRLGLGLEEGSGDGGTLLQAAGPEFCRFAAQEGLAPFLAWAAEQGGIEATGQAARNLGEITARQRDHLVRVNIAAAQTIRLLRSLEIPALACKGLVTARAWPAPLLRFMSDVDFLVSWDDRYRLWQHIGELKEVKASTGITCEVEPCHHDLSASGTVPFAFTELLDRGQPMTIAGEEATGAGWEESLLFTAVSALRKDIRSFRLMLDALFLIRRLEVDAKEILRRARELGVDRPLLLLFRQAAYHLGAADPFAGQQPAPVRRASRFLGLHRQPPRLGPRALPAPGLSRWWLRLLCESPGRTLARARENLLPAPLALRNRQARRELQDRPLAWLYLRHWCSYLGKLVSRE